jgi:hypothetical protein
MAHRFHVLLILAAAACGSDPEPPVFDGSIDGSSDASVPDASTMSDGSTPDAAPADSATPDAGAPDGSADGGATDAAPDADSASPDTSMCAPQSAAELCTAASAECGSFTGTDNCGATRTENCGGCTAPFSCGDGSAGANECGCAAPPAITGLTVSCSSGSARISFTGTTTIYSYGFFASSTGTPPPCAVGWSSYVGSPGFNMTTLPGGPALGECGAYRICAYEMMCDADFSPGRLVNMCVSASGVVTCSVT